MQQSHGLFTTAKLLVLMPILVHQTVSAVLRCVVYRTHRTLKSQRRGGLKGSVYDTRRHVVLCGKVVDVSSENLLSLSLCNAKRRCKVLLNWNCSFVCTNALHSITERFWASFCCVSCTIKMQVKTWLQTVVFWYDLPHSRRKFYYITNNDSTILLINNSTQWLSAFLYVHTVV